MNFVDFVIDCYSHITSHVSQTFTSCTHYTSYSLLNIVHVIVCVYGLTNQVFAITLNFVQNQFDAWKFMENARNFDFANFGLKFLFLKITSLHTHAFGSSISMLWVVSEIFFFFFPKNYVFFLKFSEPLPISIDPFYFSIDRNFLNCFVKVFVCFVRSNLFFNRSKLVN